MVSFHNITCSQLYTEYSGSLLRKINFALWIFLLPWKLNPITASILYNQNYWWALYLAIYSKNSIDETLNWRFWVLYGKKSMIHGIHQIWQSLYNLPNRQSKMTTKYSGWLYGMWPYKWQPAYLVHTYIACNDCH